MLLPIRNRLNFNPILFLLHLRVNDKVNIGITAILLNYI